MEYRQQIRAHGQAAGIVGVYKDPGFAPPGAIIVTEGGLLVIEGDRSTWIDFSELESTTMSGVEGEGSDILLALKSGEVVSMRVTGTDSRFRDIFSFARFLDRVLEDRLGRSRL